MLARACKDPCCLQAPPAMMTTRTPGMMCAQRMGSALGLTSVRVWCVHPSANAISQARACVVSAARLMLQREQLAMTTMQPRVMTSVRLDPASAPQNAKACSAQLQTRAMGPVLVTFSQVCWCVLMCVFVCVCVCWCLCVLFCLLTLFVLGCCFPSCNPSTSPSLSRALLGFVRQVFVSHSSRWHSLR